MNVCLIKCRRIQFSREARQRPVTRRSSPRQGGVYIVVLGSAMIIALLGMCALIGQRIENRLVVASTDIRQAQLNANTAVELATLAMKQDTNWRTTYSNGNWFTNRSTGIGSCTANVVDPIDANLANGADDPVVITGIGYSGGAEFFNGHSQREPFRAARQIKKSPEREAAAQ